MRFMYRKARKVGLATRKRLVSLPNPVQLPLLTLSSIFHSLSHVRILPLHHQLRSQTAPAWRPIPLVVLLERGLRLLLVIRSPFVNH